MSHISWALTSAVAKPQEKKRMNDRIVIDSWDWHYRVGFDQALARKVKSIANGLGLKAEQRILLRQLDIFSSMVSISALCDALEESPERSQELLDGVDTSRLLYVPPFLSTVLQDRIEQLSKKLGPEKKKISDLLSTAVTLRFINYHTDIFEPVFGNDLNRLTHNNLSNMPHAPKDKLLDPHDLKETVSLLLEVLMDSNHVNALLGDVSLPDFEIVLEEGPGFGEYWPAELLGSTSNQLTVFNNPDQLRVGILQTTLAHEVLGHGVFYEAESKYAPPFFDHGAMCLVEGWATWCEWNASATPHGKYFRAARLFGLRHFYEKNVDELLRSIPHDMRSLGYSDIAITSGLMYFFQYPGFSLSYTLGALWFEKTFHGVQPISFFESLKGRPWGDFFQVW